MARVVTRLAHSSVLIERGKARSLARTRAAVPSEATLHLIPPPHPLIDFFS